MLRNVALNQLTVIERITLLFFFGLLDWLAKHLPDTVGVLRPVAAGSSRRRSACDDRSVVVISGVGWICGGLDLTAPQPQRRRGSSPARSGWLSIFGRTRRAREPRGAAD